MILLQLVLAITLLDYAFDVFLITKLEEWELLYQLSYSKGNEYNEWNEILNLHTFYLFVF